MQFQFIFRHIDSSEALQEYAVEHFSKMQRFYKKGERCLIEFSMSKHNCEIDVTITGRGGPYKSSATSDDFYRAVDEAVDKLDRQFQKKKEQLRNHKFPERSRDGKLERLNDSLEYDNHHPFKKTS